MLARFFSMTRPRLSLGSRACGLLSYHIDLSTFDSHIYCCGASGNGKSSWLFHVLTSLFTFAATGQYQCGMTLIDPHADLANDFLAYLWYRKYDLKHVLYVDPARTDYIIPANVLNCTYANPYEIAESIVESWRRVWPKSLEEAPRFAQILRNAILVLVENNLSLVELERFLTDKAFRAGLVINCSDPAVVAFFENQYDQWKDQLAWASPVLNKASAIIFKPTVRAMLGAKENRLDMRRLADEGRTIIINVGSFRDEWSKKLIGALLLTSLEQAAFSRESQLKHERIPHWVVLDECSYWVSRDETALARGLSELRKYRYIYVLAHQDISQFAGTRLMGAAMTNAKCKVLFGTGRKTAKTLAEEIFSPNMEKIKHEIIDEAQRERSHPLFAPLYEQLEVAIQKIQKLKPRQILVQPTENARLMKLRTPTIHTAPVSLEQLDETKRYLVARDGVPYATLLKQVNQRFLGRLIQHRVRDYDRS